MIQNGVLTYAGTTITTGSGRGLEMPKSTQIPEVGDWVIVSKRLKGLESLYGERLKIIDVVICFIDDIVTVFDESNDCEVDLFACDFYIVG